MQLESGFQMAQWIVRPRRGLMESGAGAVRVEPRVMSVLCCLAARPGDVVTREEFIAEVWRGRVVTDEVLSRCISQLRTALGDDPRKPRFIETVPKVGYRLLAPVAPAAVTPVAGAAPNLGTGRLPTPPRWLKMLAGGIAAGGLAMLGTVLLTRPVGRVGDPVPGPGLSIAVLPFLSASAGPEGEFLADGLSDRLLRRLADVPGLKVVGRTSSIDLKRRNLSPEQVARELNVTHVLKGSARAAGAHLSVTAELLEASRGVRLWSKSFDRDLGDARAIPDDIARAVADTFHIAGVPQLEWQPTRLQSHNPDVYRLYLVARGELFQSTDDSLVSARRDFAEIIRREPRFAEAHAGLAITCAVQARFFGDRSPDVEQRAVASAEQALALDPASSEAHLARAMVQRLRYERHGDVAGYRAAPDDFRQAIALDPANAFAYLLYGFAVSRDDPTLGNRLYGRALELDPLLQAATFQTAVNERALGDYPAARRSFMQLLERGLEPTTVYDQLLITERFAGRPQAAVAASRKGAPGLDRWAAYMDVADLSGAQQAINGMAADGPDGALRAAAALAMRRQFREEWRLLAAARQHVPADETLAPAAAHLALMAGEPVQAVRIIGERFPGLFGDLEAINAYNVSAALDLAAALRDQGAADSARRLIDRVASYLDGPTAFRGPPPTIFRAAMRALQGENDAALAELEHGFEAGYRMLWNVSLTPGLIPAPYPVDADPRLGSLRGDPRFVAWLRKVRAANAHPDASGPADLRPVTVHELPEHRQSLAPSVRASP